ALGALRAQQHRGTDRGGEQDELLAERVERAQVKRHAGHGVGHVPLVQRDARAQPPRRARQCGGHGQLPDRRDQQRAEDEQAGAEEQQPDASAHRSRSSSLASASSTIAGTTIVATAICDSATSGAPKVKNRTASASPRNPATTTWRAGSRTATVAVPAAATTSRAVTCSAFSGPRPGRAA